MATGSTSKIPRVPTSQPLENPADDLFSEVDPVSSATPTSSGDASVVSPNLGQNSNQNTDVANSPVSATGSTMFGATENNNPTQSAPQEMQQDGAYTIKGPVLSRGIMTILIVAIVVLGIGGGFWWVYNTFMVTDENLADPYVQEGVVNQAEDEKDVVPEGVFFEDDEVETRLDQEIGEVVEDDEEAAAQILDTTPNEQEVDNTILFGTGVDSDSDGLDDEREVRLGLDPQNWDTDYDALGDGDEVIIWKTDPLNKDTDGDSYPDGLEVQTGHNPKGPGKIFDKDEDEVVDAKEDEDVAVPESTDSVIEKEPTEEVSDSSEVVDPVIPAVDPVVEPEQEGDLGLPLEASVSISGMSFTNETVVLAVGGTVRWVQNDAAPHDVVSDGNFASSVLNAGDTFSHTFTEPGTYTYYCSIHPSMRGTVIVQ